MKIESPVDKIIKQLEDLISSGQIKPGDRLPPERNLAENFGVGRSHIREAIDEGIRDTHQIIEADIPVFYEYRISNGSLGRCLITHYQIPINIGDVTIKPGDIVIGDIDGVLVVPREIAFDVLVRAEENEKKIFGWVKEGQSVKEITEKGGYF